MTLASAVLHVAALALLCLDRAAGQTDRAVLGTCAWVSKEAALECSLSLEQAVLPGSSFGRIPPTSSLRQARRFRLRCTPGEDGDDNGRGRQQSVRNLRDLLDMAFEKVLSSRNSSTSLSWQQRLRSVEVIQCPLSRLERLDLLYIDSSVTSDLQQLGLSSLGDEPLEIEPDAFQDGPRGLKVLDLSQSGLDSLLRARDGRQSVLCPLRSSLQQVNLSSNALTDSAQLGLSNASASCPLNSLLQLDLSANDLQRLPRGAFVRAKNLQDLDVSRNSLAGVDAAALADLKGLKVLSLAHNQIKNLPTDLVEAKNGLRELYLNNNSLAGLPPGLLERLSALVVLNLSQNALTNKALGGRPFSALRSLVALDLSHNKLSALSQDLFAGLASLQVLTVAHNELHSVAVGAFNGLGALHALVLAHNQVESLSPRLFDGLEKLNSLAIDHNRIKGLNRDLFRNCCSSLQDLSLHSNEFRHIPHPALKALTALRTLDLGENQITEVHRNALSGLKSLYGLRLAGNRLEKLDDGVFEQAEDIKMLNLADNRIEKIEQNVFRPLKKLRALRLDNNRLEDINGLLTTQHQLQWLNVSHNALQWFDYAFIPKSLLWLNLRGNVIEELGNYYDMQAGFHLVHLDVSANRLTRIDRQSLVHSLRELRLDSNEISDLAANTFSGLSNLTSVNMSHNALQKFSLNSLAITLDSQPGQKQKAVQIRLQGNPLICDCEMEWMQRINQLAQKAPREFPVISDWDELTCSLNNRQDLSSSSGGGGGNASASLVLPLSRVQPSEFICEYQTHCFALCMCCDFFACDCRMRCSEGCDCFHDQTWSSNIIQCGRRNHATVPEFIPMDATAIYLDGNNLTDLSKHTFIGRKHLSSLYLNNSGIVRISNKTVNGLSELVALHLDRNSISELTGGEFVDLESLKELYLDHNELAYVHASTFSMLTSLEVLTLDHNRLVDFEFWSLADNPGLASVRLGSNLWSCQCRFLQAVQPFLKEKRALIHDYALLECVDRERNHAVALNTNITCGDDVMAVSFRTLGDASAASASGTSDEDLDPAVLNRLIPLVAIVSAACVIVLSLIIMAVAFRKPVTVWLHSKYGVRLLQSSSQANSTLSGGKARQFDAFVLYTLTDSVFLQQNLMPHLEPADGKSASYRLFLRHRDFSSLQSRTLTEAFDHVIENSARILLLASSDFLLSDSCRSELSILMEKLSMRKRESNVIVLALNNDKKRVQQIVGSRCTLLRWTDPSFWQKLRYHLPEPTGSGHLLGLGQQDIGKTLSQSQIKSEYEDDMWTYVKGMNGAHSGGPECGGRSSGSSGSGSGETPGTGQDSSLSTRSTTDNSHATLPLSTSPISNGAALASGPRRPLPPAGAASTLQHKPANLIVNPLQVGGHTTTRGFQPRGRQQQQTNLDFSQFRGHDLLLHQQHQHSDSDYMSVSDSLNRNQSAAANRLYHEPIYHTLEPDVGEVAPAVVVARGAAGSVRGGSSGAGGKLGGGKSDSTVYINADLEVVYPKQRGGLSKPQQYLAHHEDLDDFVDEDDELLAPQEDTTEDDDGLFDLSRSRHGSYVPSPAPGSFPRPQMAAASTPRKGQHARKAPPSALHQLQLQQQQQAQAHKFQQHHPAAGASQSNNHQSAYYI